jgi:DNA-binding transcriptional regulator of glucitol operon
VRLSCYCAPFRHRETSMTKRRFAHLRQLLSPREDAVPRRDRMSGLSVSRPKGLKNLAGISFDVSLRRRQVDVQFEESVISASAIQQAVERAVNRPPFDE